MCVVLVVIFCGVLMGVVRVFLWFVVVFLL